MVTLDWTTDHVGGVGLVTLRIESDGRARRVRVEDRTDGPVWPPRQHGRPVAGWDDTGFAGVVGPDDPLALGYATPGRPVEPPAEVVADDPLPEADDSPGTSPPADAERVDGTTPAGVVRSLGDPTVPREAVPVPDAGTEADSVDSTGGSHDDAVALSARLAAIERRLTALER